MRTTDTSRRHHPTTCAGTRPRRIRGGAVLLTAVVLAGCTAGPAAIDAAEGTGSPSGSASPSGSGSVPACTFTGSLTAFYTPPSDLGSLAPGTLLRCQLRTDINNGSGLPGALAYRVMYVTEAPAPSGAPVGTYVAGAPLVKRVSTGMVFAPTSPAVPGGGRRVVAWDHGTVGMAPGCAPSIKAYQTVTRVEPGSKPNESFGFVQNMVDNGWLVAATDYAGLGLQGRTGYLTEQYLLGVSEAMDTVNAVRSARTFAGQLQPTVPTASSYAVYGQSQGGHATLFTGSVSPTYAPDLTLVGLAASDPAAQMQPLVKGQWNKLISWVLGPEVTVAWPKANTSLAAASIVTLNGASSMVPLANECVTVAGVDALIKRDIQRQGTYFTSAVNTNARWQAMLAAQTPPVVSGVPVLVGQATNDGVVLASTTYQLQQTWCPANPDLRMYWVPPPPSEKDPTSLLNGVQAHLTSAWVDALPAITWIADRFDGTNHADAVTTPCTQPPPTPLS